MVIESSEPSTYFPTSRNVARARLAKKAHDVISISVHDYASPLGILKGRIETLSKVKDFSLVSGIWSGTVEAW